MAEPGVVIQLRRGPSAEWALDNPVLKLGETGWETDTLRVKLGDGVTAWNDLPFAADEAASVAAEVVRAMAAEADLQDQIDTIEASDVETVAGVSPVGGDVPVVGLQTALSLPANTVTSLSTLTTNLGTEVTNRTNADTALQTNINTEASTRGTADTTLQTNINTKVTKPDLDSWPVYLYGNSYAVLNAAFFTPGNHYSEQVADALDGGAATSYAVGATRSVHAVYSLLSGTAPANVSAAVAGAMWPGTSTRNGLVIFDTLGNDVGHYPSMNVSPVVPAVITSANTRYLDSMEAQYKTMLAFASMETKHEQTTGTFGGVWGSQALAGAQYSGGSIAFTTTVGTYWEKSVTPAQSGPLAGKVYLVVAALDASVGTMAQITTTVDGGSSTNFTPSAWEQYTGVGGSQVNVGWGVVTVTVPTDGAAHTVRMTHAGSAGHFMYLDCLLIPSTDPNPIPFMGVETPPVVHAGVFNQAGIDAWRYNLPLVKARTQAAVAAFPNAFYVPSTMTTNGLYSGDGLHPNDRGMTQRANDLQTAITTAIRARLESRRLSNLPDGDFPVI